MLPPAMLALARESAPGAEQFARLVLPDDAIPVCDAIVAVGHPFSYLPDEESVDRAFVAAAEALRPDGVLAVDICDLEWGTRAGTRPTSAVRVRTGPSSPSSPRPHPSAS